MNALLEEEIKEDENIIDSVVPGYFVALGDFKTAFELLKKQIGLNNQAPL